MCNSNQYANSSTRFNYGAAKWPLPPPRRCLAWAGDGLSYSGSIRRHTLLVMTWFRYYILFIGTQECILKKERVGWPGQARETVDCEWKSDWLTDWEWGQIIVCFVRSCNLFAICCVFCFNSPRTALFIHTKKKIGLAWLGLHYKYLIYSDGGADQGSSLNNNYFHLIYVMVS